MLTVACLKWGQMYGPEYVDALHAAARRHLTVPFTFKCFTDDPSWLHGDIFTAPLPGDLHGWWNKLWLFNEYAFHPGTPIIYIDLDTVILRNIDALAGFTGAFACLRDFYRPRGFGSGFMLWRAGAMNFVWDDFVADGQPELPGGDQAFLEISAHRKWGREAVHGRDHILQDLFPGMFASYKADCANGPGEAAVICFHGQPKPHNCGADWVAQNWNTPRSRAPSAA
jgi:hypothetical protein